MKCRLIGLNGRQGELRIHTSYDQMTHAKDKMRT
jgi:hypothetical protein